MVEGLEDRRTTAAALIEKKDFRTESLLQIQEYFFDFAERTHLLKVDEKAGEVIRKIVKKMGGQEFSQKFVLTKRQWAKLEAYCSAGPTYVCSFEMQQYPAIVSALKKMLGDEAASEIARASGL